MTTPTIPTSITLNDGKARELHYTFRALQAIKKTTGKSILHGGLAGLDEDLLPVLLFEGLTDKTGITADDVAGLMDVQQMKYYAESFAAAFGLSAPEPDPDAPAKSESSPNVQ